MIAQPPPKADVMARRDDIVAGLGKLVPATGLIHEALRLKPYETDGLPAYRQMPLAVVLHVVAVRAIVRRLRNVPPPRS